jgi:hypothetical protein
MAAIPSVLISSYLDDTDEILAEFDYKLVKKR